MEERLLGRLVQGRLKTQPPRLEGTGEAARLRRKGDARQLFLQLGFQQSDLLKEP